MIAFDEPTSSLSEHEVDACSVDPTAADQGVAVIYVSHRMKEVFQLADRVVVLRDGEVAGSAPAAEMDERALVRLMVGRDCRSCSCAIGPRRIGWCWTSRA